MCSARFKMAPPRAQRLPCAKEAVSAPQSVGEIIDLPSPAHIPCPNGNPNPFSVSHFPLKQKRSHPDTLTHRIVPEPKLSHYHHTTESDLFPLRFLSAPSQKKKSFLSLPEGVGGNGEAAKRKVRISSVLCPHTL